MARGGPPMGMKIHVGSGLRPCRRAYARRGGLRKPPRRAETRRQPRRRAGPTWTFDRADLERTRSGERFRQIVEEHRGLRAIYHAVIA